MSKQETDGVISRTDLIALLREAADEFDVLASYVDDPETVWPSSGLKMTAKAQKKLRDVIRLNLKRVPTDEFTLLEENWALRCALRAAQSNDDWRLRYLEAQRKFVVARNARDKQSADIERLKAALRRMIDDDCWYGDGCTTDKRCHPCEARHALGIPYDEQKFEKLRWEREERQQAAAQEEEQ